MTTREPGGTPLGEDLRQLLLHRPMHSPETEALLMFAARREHIAEIIEPALSRGDWVISDRFTDATFAYQGGGRDLPTGRLEVLETWVQGGLQPDLTLLFDVPLETASARLAGARAPTSSRPNRALSSQRTRDEYLRRAAAAPERFRVIDATRSIDEIRVTLDEIIASL